nr:hypothetical protein [uncultured Treponema sp.]
MKRMEKNGGILCLTADHGNSDDMNEHKKDGSVAMGADGGRFFIQGLIQPLKTSESRP